MPYIQIIFPERRRQIKQAAKRDLFWYDSEKQKMLCFSGTDLTFKFKLDKELSPPRNRLLPEAVINESFITVNKTDPQDFINWWDDYQDGSNEAGLVIGSLSETDVTIDVPDEELNDFLESLTDNDFSYEVLD